MPSIERRIEETQKTPGGVPPSEEEIVVLRPKKLFGLQSYSSLRFTNNAFLSDEMREHDHIFVENLTAGAATRIAEKFDVFADAGFFFGRYSRNNELDYDGVFARLGAAIPIRRASLSFSYSPLVAYDRGFDDQTLALHEFEARLTGSYFFRDRLGIYPYLSLARTLANPEDFEQTTGRIGADLSYSLRDDLYAFGTIEATVRRYDSFFEEATRESRRDSGFGMLIGVAWSPREWATLYAITGANWLSSTVDALSYEELFATPSVSLHVRF